MGFRLKRVQGFQRGHPSFGLLLECGLLKCGTSSFARLSRELPQDLVKLGWLGFRVLGLGFWVEDLPRVKRPLTGV